MQDRIDTLDRDTYLDFITSVISNSEEYKRDEESKSFVMAIDSAWGTGKTFLLDLLRKRYTDDKRISIIKYSAWQNDFWGSAFEPFAQAIFSSDIFSDLINKNSKKEKAAKITKESIVNIVKIIGKGVAHKFIEKNAGEDVASLFKELTDASIQIGAYLFLKEKDMVFPELTSFQNSIKLLREALSSILIGQKLVIVIDELDRCKPLFAIETLEIIKHIFNVDGLIFILALDMQQLKHSLNKVYGANMDSVGYLLRFFDYVSVMPEGNRQEYIEQLFKDKKVFNDIESAFFVDLLSETSLSIREINIIFKGYFGFALHELVGITDKEIYMNYLKLFILKYKQPHVYIEFFKGSNSDKEALAKENKDITSIIPLENIPKKICGLSVVTESRMGSTCEAFIVDVIDSKINMRYFDTYHNAYRSLQKTLEEELVLGGLFTSRDIRNWKAIKDVPLCEYLFSKLEMYDFSETLL